MQKLYLMKNEIGLYKIGISNNPLRRSKDIANNSGIPVTLVQVWDCLRDARVVENELHTLLHSSRRMGEWFDYGCSSLIRLCDKYSNIAGVKSKTTEVRIPKLNSTRKCATIPLDNKYGLRKVSWFDVGSDQYRQYHYKLLVRKLNYIKGIRSTVVRTSIKALTILGSGFNFTIDTWLATNKKIHTDLDNYRCLYEEVYNYFKHHQHSELGQDVDIILDKIRGKCISEDFYKKCKSEQGFKLNYRHTIQNPVRYFKELQSKIAP